MPDTMDRLILISLMINGEYYISEVNPRFGGGYPHAYESGATYVSYR